MKMRLLLFAMIFTSGFCIGQSLTHQEVLDEMNSAEAFIANQKLEFSNPETSPLPADSIQGFHGPEYFRVNPAYIVNAHFEVIENGPEFEMKTSTDRLPLYKDYAVLTFHLNGQEFTLHAYQNVKYSKIDGHEKELFVPFNDYTNGIETYGGGRYLDLEIPENDLVILNFNKTYNPYCAYSVRYSCPIPPDENKLEIGIEAGVKKYH